MNCSWWWFDLPVMFNVAAPELSAMFGKLILTCLFPTAPSVFLAPVYWASGGFCALWTATGLTLSSSLYVIFKVPLTSDIVGIASPMSARSPVGSTTWLSSKPRIAFVSPLFCSSMNNAAISLTAFLLILILNTPSFGSIFPSM